MKFKLSPANRKKLQAAGVAHKWQQDETSIVESLSVIRFVFPCDEEGPGYFIEADRELNRKRDGQFHINWLDSNLPDDIKTRMRTSYPNEESFVRVVLQASDVLKGKR